MASANGHLDVVLTLLDYNVDVHAKDNVRNLMMIMMTMTVIIISVNIDDNDIHSISNNYISANFN